MSFSNSSSTRVRQSGETGSGTSRIMSGRSGSEGSTFKGSECDGLLTRKLMTDASSSFGVKGMVGGRLLERGLTPSGRTKGGRETED